eukprot:5114515-Amphidinium_carterae.1
MQGRYLKTDRVLPNMRAQLVKLRGRSTTRIAPLLSGAVLEVKYADMVCIAVNLLMIPLRASGYLDSLP